LLVAETKAGGGRFDSSSGRLVESWNRSKARSTISGDGWTYRCEITMLLCPAIRMMVKPATQDSPSPVNIVWRRLWSTKSFGKIGVGGFHLAISWNCENLPPKRSLATSADRAQ